MTAINYFIYDLGDESYYLPFPIVYVQNYRIESFQQINSSCDLMFSTRFPQGPIQPAPNTSWLRDGICIRIRSNVSKWWSDICRISIE